MTICAELQVLRLFVHYGLHLIFPAIIAIIFFREYWLRAWLIMILTMLIDLDHLFANPVFDPGRCSIGFHPLHSFWAIGVYILLLFFPKTRVVAVGLLIHIIADWQDCLWM
jgi:hypothetical protein